MNSFLKQALLFVFFSCALTFHSKAQKGVIDDDNSSQKPDKTYKYQSFVGLVYKANIPTPLFNGGPVTIPNNGQTTVVSSIFSYNFGGILRLGFSKKLSFETGVMMNRRAYKLTHEIVDSSIFVRDTIRTLNFEIPLNLLVYVQLDKNIFASVAAGLNLNFFPSDYASQVIAKNHKFVQEIKNNHLNDLSFDLNANIGFEYRSVKNGTFYLGISNKIPAKPTFKTAVVHEINNTKFIAQSTLSGSQFSIDVRYFFPYKTRKGTQFIPGPIVQ